MKVAVEKLGSLWSDHHPQECKHGARGVSAGMEFRCVWGKRAGGKGE